jgi:hypothetical protein
LHFFEQPDAEVFAYPETFERYAFVRGVLQHVAFALRRRLAAFGVGMTGITNVEPVSNTLFRDNNGPLLDAT